MSNLVLEKCVSKWTNAKQINVSLLLRNYTANFSPSPNDVLMVSCHALTQCQCKKLNRSQDPFSFRQVYAYMHCEVSVLDEAFVLEIVTSV